MTATTPTTQLGCDDLVDLGDESVSTVSEVRCNIGASDRGDHCLRREAGTNGGYRRRPIDLEGRDRISPSRLNSGARVLRRVHGLLQSSRGVDCSKGRLRIMVIADPGSFRVCGGGDGRARHGRGLAHVGGEAGQREDVHESESEQSANP
jgi:hypothetical protein